MVCAHVGFLWFFTEVFIDTDAVLPKYIPVAIYFGPPVTTPLYEPSSHREHPSVFMVFPRNSPGTSISNVSVRLDTSASHGVRVTVNGYPDTKGLEEMVRRGGIFGLPGQLWKDK